MGKMMKILIASLLSVTLIFSPFTAAFAIEANLSEPSEVPITADAGNPAPEKSETPREESLETTSEEIQASGEEAAPSRPSEENEPMEPEESIDPDEGDADVLEESSPPAEINDDPVPAPVASSIPKTFSLTRSVPDSEIISVSISPERVAPTRENSPAIVTAKVLMNSPNQEFFKDSDAAVILEFWKIEGSPEQTITIRCDLDESQTNESIYTFVGTEEIPHYDYPGVYELQLLDCWANDKRYGTDAIREAHPTWQQVLDLPRDWQVGFAVETSGGDSTPPVPQDVEIVPPQITLSGEDVKVKLRLKITDDLSGVGYIDGVLSNPEHPGQQVDIDFPNDLSACLTADGFYETDVTISKYASVGNWKLEYLDLEDCNGNYRSYFNEAYSDDYDENSSTKKLDSSLCGNVLTITGSSLGDDYPPVLEKVEITPTSVNVREGTTLRIALTITDEGGSGFDPESPENDIIIETIYTGERLKMRAQYMGDPDKPPADNVYIYENPVDSYRTKENCTYYITRIPLSDKAGNKVVYGSSVIPANNADRPLPNEATLTVGAGGRNPLLPDEGSTNPLIWYKRAAVKFPGTVPDAFSQLEMTTRPNGTLHYKYRDKILAGANLWFYTFKNSPSLPGGSVTLTLGGPGVSSSGCYVYSISGSDTLADITSKFSYRTDTQNTGIAGWSANVSSLGAYLISDTKLLSSSSSGGGGGGGKGGGGKGGGGGGKGGGGGAGGTANVSLVKTATATKSTTNAVSNAIAAAKKAGLNMASANATIKVGTEVSPQTAKAVAKAAATAAANKGVTVTSTLSLEKWKIDRTTQKNVLQYRATFDPTKWTALANLKFSLKTDDSVIRATLAKIYSNQMAIIKFDQAGTFGMPVTFAVKPDLSKLNRQTLQFYAYDKTKKTITLIQAPNYWLDKSGYLHFTTTSAGHIIITDKALIKK